MVRTFYQGLTCPGVLQVKQNFTCTSCVLQIDNGTLTVGGSLNFTNTTIFFGPNSTFSVSGTVLIVFHDWAIEAVRPL